jgi:hypothetical protein
VWISIEFGWNGRSRVFKITYIYAERVMIQRCDDGKASAKDHGLGFLLPHGVYRAHFASNFTSLGAAASGAGLASCLDEHCGRMISCESFKTIYGKVKRKLEKGHLYISLFDSMPCGVSS